MCATSSEPRSPPVPGSRSPSTTPVTRSPSPSQASPQVMWEPIPPEPQPPPSRPTRRTPRGSRDRRHRSPSSPPIRVSPTPAPLAHVHSGSDITTGTVATARLNVGTTAGTVAAGTTAVSPTPAPTAHAATHADGGGGDLPRRVGVTSGTVGTQRLGSGTGTRCSFVATRRGLRPPVVTAATPVRFSLEACDGNDSQVLGPTAPRDTEPISRSQRPPPRCAARSRLQPWGDHGDVPGVAEAAGGVGERSPCITQLATGDSFAATIGLTLAATDVVTVRARPLICRFLCSVRRVGVTHDSPQRRHVTGTVNRSVVKRRRRGCAR